MVVEVISGVEGPCLSVGTGEVGQRIAGPKPWGGGTVEYSFKVGKKELLDAVKEFAK